MSLRARLRRADARRRARWSAQRARVLAAQAGPPPTLVALAAAIEAGNFVACNPDDLIERWNRAHPEPCPDMADYQRRCKARRRRRR